MFRNITPVVLNLIIVNALVFVILNLFPPIEAYFVLNKSNALGFRETCTYQGNDYYIDANGRCIDLSVDDFKPVQLVTTFFAHVSFMHILFNMLALYSLGGPIEMVLGSKRFLEFYLFCGIFSSLLLAFIDPSNYPVLGASTAISGIIVAFALFFPDSKLIMFPIPIPISAKVLVGIVFVISLGAFLLENRHIIAPSNISHFGHLSGMVGALVYFFFGRFLGLNRKQ